MNEVASILGLSSDELKLGIPDTVGETADESNLDFQKDELETMRTAAETALNALRLLESKSVQFENEIRQLAQDMNALKSRSSSLHHRLSTREQALKLIEPLLAEYAIPSTVIDIIYEGEMDASWYDALERILKPLESSNEESPKVLEGALKLRRILIARAIERAKAFYITKLRMLRRPGINAQRIQLEMIQGGESMALLMRKAPKLASALYQAYRNTIKWYYTMLFGKYGRWLNRQPLVVVQAPKLLGTAASQSGTGSLSTMGPSTKTLEFFSVGARPSVLQSSDETSPAIPMSVSTPSATYLIEVLVRSLLVALADSFEVESKVTGLVFANQSPRASDQPSANATEPKEPVPVVSLPDNNRVEEVFEPTLAFYSDVIGGWILQNTGDIFGLLLIVNLVEASTLNEWASAWLESISKRCWPHIINILEQQAASIEQAALKASIVAKGKNAPQGPHLLTHLLSSYLSGILQLCSRLSIPSQQKISKNLKSLVEAHELFISKLAGGDERILYNNYFVMSALIGDIEGQIASEIFGHYQLLVKAFAPSSSK